MDRIARAKRRRWADTVVLVTAGFVTAWAVWVYPNAGPEVNEGTLYAVYAIGGVTGIASVPAALRSTILARVLLATSVLILLGGAFTAFEEFSFGALATVLIPALILLAMIPFIGPMPTPEQEGLKR